MNESIKYEGDCRTAPATPGLLNNLTLLFCIMSSFSSTPTLPPPDSHSTGVGGAATTHDAAIVVTRHLKLALSVQAAAVTALLSFNKLVSVIINMFRNRRAWFLPGEEPDEKGSKGDEELK